MRTEYIITRVKELALMEQFPLVIKEQYPDLTPENTLVIMVSPDYSASVAMHMAHGLSKNGEMCDILPIHIPYPDANEYIKMQYKQRARKELLNYLVYSDRPYKNYLLVEAGVIQGNTYKWLVEEFSQLLSGRIITAALFENKHSGFKSDVVMEYYDNETQDLTFYFEQENKHWN